MYGNGLSRRILKLSVFIDREKERTTSFPPSSPGLIWTCGKYQSQIDTHYITSARRALQTIHQPCSKKQLMSETLIRYVKSETFNIHLMKYKRPTYVPSTTWKRRNLGQNANNAVNYLNKIRETENVYIIKCIFFKKKPFNCYLIEYRRPTDIHPPFLTLTTLKRTSKRSLLSCNFL